MQLCELSSFILEWLQCILNVNLFCLSASFLDRLFTNLSHTVNNIASLSWHFILPVRFSYLGLLRMRASILHPFSHAEQPYLMYLHYCKGMFRVGIGPTLLVDVNKTIYSVEKNIYFWFPVLAVSLLSTNANITCNYCMCITVRVGLGLW